MKQHPIPQNILDVEFKLFTRFTVREFAYMAIGIGFGGIFLYFFSRGEVPGFVAIPIFIVSTGVGLILGLTKINDQNADVFVRNYITAITKPTLRVWRSENFDEKVEWIAKQRGLTLTKASLDREVNLQEKSNTRVVGGTAKIIPGGQYVDEKTLDAIDQEEEEALKNIDAVALETTGVAPPGSNAEIGRPTTTFVQEEKQSLAPQQERPQQKEVITPSTTQDDSQQKETVSPVTEREGVMNREPTPIPNQTSQIKADPDSQLPPIMKVEDSHEVKEPVTPEKPTEVPKEQFVPQQQSPINTPQIEKVESPQPSSSVSTSNQILINKDTVESYKTEVEDFKPGPGTIALYLTDTEGSGVPQAMALVKDQGGSVVQALQSDPQGLILPNKEFSKGEYIVNIQHDKYKFPRVNFILEGAEMPVVNIKSI